MFYVQSVREVEAGPYVVRYLFSPWKLFTPGSCLHQIQRPAVHFLPGPSVLVLPRSIIEKMMKCLATCQPLVPVCSPVVGDLWTRGPRTRGTESDKSSL